MLSTFNVYKFSMGGGPRLSAIVMWWNSNHDAMDRGGKKKGRKRKAEEVAPSSVCRVEMFSLYSLSFSNRSMLFDYLAGWLRFAQVSQQARKKEPAAERVSFQEKERRRRHPRERHSSSNVENRASFAALTSEILKRSKK
jgi:hypothetical protein